MTAAPPLVVFARAVGISALAVLAGVAAGTLLMAERPPAATATARAQVVAVRGLSPFAALGVRTGDVVEGARAADGELIVYVVRDGQRLTIRAHGIDNPFVSALLLNPPLAVPK